MDRKAITDSDFITINNSDGTEIIWHIPDWIEYMNSNLK